MDCQPKPVSSVSFDINIILFDFRKQGMSVSLTALYSIKERVCPYMTIARAFMFGVMPMLFA